MRDDFVVFIITHKRPDNQITYKTLKRGKYTGKIIFALDDGDDTIDVPDVLLHLIDLRFFIHIRL